MSVREAERHSGSEVLQMPTVQTQAQGRKDEEAMVKIPQAQPNLRHVAMIQEIQQSGKQLNAWEEDWCVSVAEQLEMGYALSERQLEILERIHGEKTAETTRKPSRRYE
jgi:hypothetical protein